MLDNISERDNYKMPPLYTGKVTFEVSKKKEQIHAEAEKRKQALKSKYKIGLKK